MGYEPSLIRTSREERGIYGFPKLHFYSSRITHVVNSLYSR